jgi:hypothetical protein
LAGLINKSSWFIKWRERGFVKSYRNGAPFADLPEPLQRLRRGLFTEPGGDRLMAQVLALVFGAGLEAVLVAVELALESAPGQRHHLPRLRRSSKRRGNYTIYDAVNSPAVSA